MKYLLALVVLMALIGNFGCQKKGPTEKVGKKVDEMVDKVKEGENILKQKGPMEKFGESIDESVGK